MLSFFLLSQAEVLHAVPQQVVGEAGQDCGAGAEGGGVKQEVCSSSMAGSEVRENAAALTNLPRGPQCSLCLKEARKPMELICDGSTVCWGCAVKVNNKTSLSVFPL